MKIADIEFPEPLLAALRSRDLVIFAGAGVSMGSPASLPSFAELADRIAANTGMKREDGEPEDRFIGRLADKGIRVHERAALALQIGNPRPTLLHCDLLGLYPNPAEVRLVTTNFDLLFEAAAREQFPKEPESFRAPALPLGRDFRGIVHVHGSLVDPARMVLTDSDFGRAYLVEGWARRFLVDLFRNSTVLIIGYSHNDTIMQYLARALPEQDIGRRYAFTGAKEDQDWRALGIEPITFPMNAPDDYSALSGALSCLVRLVKRSILDWQSEVTQIASKAPPVGDEDSGTLEMALRSAETTRFFAATAVLDEWIEWLDARGYLDGLINDSSPSISERDAILATWLVERFASSEREVLLLFLARRGFRMHRDLWHLLCRHFGARKASNAPEDNERVRRWITVLLSIVPAGASHHHLMWLGERSAATGNTQNVLKVFRTLTDVHYKVAAGFAVPVEQSPLTAVDVEARLAADHFILNKLLNECIKPRLDDLADALLMLVHERLEEMHFVLVCWNKASRKWDPSSFRRAAIEPNSHSSFVGSIDVLIDAGRDCLQHIAGKDPVATDYWCNLFARSDAPLLRRIAVYATMIRGDATSDEKVSWLLDRIGLHGISTHHEVFQLMKFAFPTTSKELRNRAIEDILAHRVGKDDDPDSRRQNDYYQFNWLNWLHDAAPDCDLTKSALDHILADHPEFTPREHPDLTHWVGKVELGPQSPWSPEELVAKPPAEWLLELLAPQPDSVRGWGRDGVVHGVAAAARQDIEWGLDLAQELARAGHWDSDLWPALLNIWSTGPLDEPTYKKAFSWICRPELREHHAHAIADALHELVKNGGKPYALQMLPMANDVARSLWPTLRADLHAPPDDWLMRAIDEPAGLIAEFWLGSMSIWRRHKVPTPSAMNEEYATALTVIVNDATAVGIMGRSVLCAAFHFLLATDTTWTEKHLLPLFFAQSGSDEFDAAWDGFLTRGRLDAPTSAQLEPAFLRAIERMEAWSPSRRQRFVGYYVFMLTYFVADPMKSWIPAFFTHASHESRRIFADCVERLLRDANNAQRKDVWERWLCTYWKNRLQGVPVPLDEDEIKSMMGWPLQLSSLFPEAVAFAIQMSRSPVADGMLIYEIQSGDLPAQYPVAVAQLLVHLGTGSSPSYVWHDSGPLISRLLKDGLPDDLVEKLRELAVKLGLSLEP